MLESNFLSENFDSTKKSHEVPIDHLDYKYVDKCDNVKELEKIYKVLLSGSEGKFPDLEAYVARKIERLHPTSRALRKDMPIMSKLGIPKTERAALDSEMNEFFNKIDNISKTISSSAEPEESESCALPPIRNKAPVLLDPKNTQPELSEKSEQSAPVTKNKKKSPKPRDYNDWAKIEKMLDNEDDEQEKDSADLSNKKLDSKVTTNKTQINTGNSTKTLIKNLPKPEVNADIDESLKEVKADQEKCKGNEAFKSGCYEEAEHYYTKSIQYMPTAASFNNRAMAYLKLENWHLAIEDCNYVLNYEPDNVKALLRRSTAQLKKKKYEEALQDIDKCLLIEENNKKALELKAQITDRLEKDKEEIKKVTSLGGRRLQIEESSDEDEDVEEKLENIILNNTSDDKPSSIQVKDKLTGQKTSIKISEVESEDCEDTDEEEKEAEQVAKKVAVNDTYNNVIEAPIVKAESTESVDFPAPVMETVQIELPQNIIGYKDKANSEYASGQYADALEFYTFAIDALKVEKTNHLELDIYYKNTLSILYNNRASCHQKICDFKSSVADCDSALTILKSLANLQNPKEFKALRIKLMLKKSSAYETLEKFKEAFIECEELMKLDHTNQNVQHSYNRLRNILKETGQFDKLRAAKKPPQASVEEKQTESKSDVVKEAPKQDTTALYNNYKTQGNDYVKKNEYQYAVGFYTKCVELDGTNTVGYLNRSLCYVKLNQPDLAIADSSFVLEKEPKNVKALYRRASANKLKKSYDLVAKDLKKLLGLEPNNQIAAREYKEINELLAKNPSKILIKEVSSSKTEPEKSAKPKVTQESKETITKEMATEKPKKEVTKEKNTITKPVQSTSKPVTFNKITNGYEFLQSWNSVNPRDIDTYARLIASIDPADLHTIIGSKLDDEMLNKIIKSIHQLHTNKTSGFDAIKCLQSLTKTKRFNVTRLFLDTEYTNLIREVVSGEGLDTAGVEFVKRAFDFYK